MALWWRLVRFGFRLLYNEFAFTYDLVSWIVSLGAWRCWTRTALNHIPPPADGLILELAHGTGNLQIDLSAAGYRAVGYDLSAAMGQITSRKLRRRGQLARLARGRAQRLPFASASFAAAISTFPTDFIIAPETLLEVYRVLRPDGALVIVPNARLVGGGLAPLIELLYRATGQHGGSGGGDDAALRTVFAPFTIEIVEERCPHSLVTVIIARKSASASA